MAWRENEASPGEAISTGIESSSLMRYVDDLAAEMAALRFVCVAFEEYDSSWLKTENGVANLDGNQLAWFKDSESNLLALAQLTEPIL